MTFWKQNFWVSYSDAHPLVNTWPKNGCCEASEGMPLAKVLSKMAAWNITYLDDASTAMETLRLPRVNTQKRDKGIFQFMPYPQFFRGVKGVGVEVGYSITLVNKQILLETRFKGMILHCDCFSFARLLFDCSSYYCFWAEPSLSAVAVFPSTTFHWLLISCFLEVPNKHLPFTHNGLLRGKLLDQYKYGLELGRRIELCNRLSYHDFPKRKQEISWCKICLDTVRGCGRKQYNHYSENWQRVRRPLLR